MLSPNPIPNFNQSLAAFLLTYGVEFDNEKAELTEKRQQQRERFRLWASR